MKKEELGAIFEKVKPSVSQILIDILPKEAKRGIDVVLNTYDRNIKTFLKSYEEKREDRTN